MAGVNNTDTTSILMDTQLSLDVMPFRYLGIPLLADRITVGQFGELVDKIASYVKVWNSATLSYAGQSELIKSVLQGVEVFWMSIFFPSCYNPHEDCTNLSPVPMGVQWCTGRLEFYLSASFRRRPWI